MLTCEQDVDGPNLVVCDGWVGGFMEEPHTVTITVTAVAEACEPTNTAELWGSTNWTPVGTVNRRWS